MNVLSCIRRTVSTALVSAAVAGCAPPPASGRAEGLVAGGSFSVVAYNVDGLPGFLQGGRDPGGNPEKYTPIIGQKIRPYDIVNVQEDFNSHAALYANDDHPYRTATSGGAGFGSGLNTMSVFPFADDIERVHWNQNSNTDGNNLTPKGFTWLRVRLAEGVYVDVYNVHTGAGDSEEALAARRANITQLIAYAQARSQGNAILIFGDTNTRYTRTGDNIRDLLRFAGHDTWLDLMKGGTPPAQGSPALAWGDHTRVLTDYGYEFVDKIFYRGNAYITLVPQEYAVLDGEFRDAEGKMLSDHRPVYTRFAYQLSEGLRLSDQFGGPHGDSYNDVDQVPAQPVVQTLTMRSGSRVDQVSLTLAGGTTFAHGGGGGSPQSLTLQPGEHVVSATLYADKYSGHTRIFYARFVTDGGRAIAGGSKSGASVTYTAPSGWQIVGFHGRSSDNVDKLGLIYAPIP